MSSKASIVCHSLVPDEIEAFFELCQDPTAEFTAHSRVLSSLENDLLPEGVAIKDFLQDYFTGKRVQVPVNVELDELNHLPALQGFDLLYRNGALAVREAWVMNRISALINSRRVFVVACFLNFRKVIDCFIEVHAPEWFGSLFKMIPSQAMEPFIYAPYIISADGSAKKLGDSYFIHGGTNYWNRAWLPSTRWDSRWEVHLRNWQGLIVSSCKLAKKLNAKNFQFLFIPEKDTLIRTATPGVFQSGLLPMLLMQRLMDVAPPKSVLFPVQELVNSEDNMTRFQAGDSHLSATDYWIVFQLLLERFDLKKFANREVSFEFIPGAGDLGSKLNIINGRRQILNLDMQSAEVVGGQSELQIPLRDNYVNFNNHTAPIKKSLLILGDSHSSIGSNPQLTYLASHFFSHVEFFWNPFNIHAISSRKLALKSYDYILFESSQRFTNPAID